MNAQVPRDKKTTELAWNVQPPNTSPCPITVRVVDVNRIVWILVCIRVKPRFTIYSFAFEDKKCAGVCETMIGSCTHISTFLTDLVTALSPPF